MASHRKNILICDDHPIFRLGLKALLEKNQWTVFEASSTEEILPILRDTTPDAIVMDFILQNENGIEIIDNIRSAGVNCPTLLLTNSTDRKILEKCREKNIEGFCSKRESLENISILVDRIASGETVHIEPYREPSTGVKDKTNPFVVLSNREVEVVRKLVSGETQNQIAHEMEISVRTLEKHRQNINDKLGKKTLSDLTRLAYVWGLVDDPELIRGS